MNLFRYAAHPVSMLLLIAAFAWLLFASPAGTGINKAKELEQEREDAGRRTPPLDPNLNVVAAQEGQAPVATPEPSPEEIPFAPNAPQGQFSQWGQPQAGQGVAYAPTAQYPDPAVVRPVLNNGRTMAAPAPTQPIPMPDKVLQEGHWIGLEAIPITPALAKANNIPPDISGVLVDEVTLLSAEAGLLAGDVITNLNEQPVQDLKSFREATRQVAMSRQADITVYRGGANKKIAIYSTEELGIAQVESAPMILSGAKAPHGYYGPCDRCHSIAKTATNINNLKMDNGDNLTKIAPAIHSGATAPHRDRGKCTNCHTVI